MGSGPVTGFWGPSPHVGMPHPVLMQGEELGLNLMCHTLLMPIVGLPFSEERWRRSGSGKGMVRGKGLGGKKRRKL